uniref:Uncharacterized protein n=1 Tax=Anopheles coluzzii TaxID=1518534 RepID=A0ABM2BF02_ANOCL
MVDRSRCVCAWCGFCQTVFRSQQSGESILKPFPAQQGQRFPSLCVC